MFRDSTASKKDAWKGYYKCFLGSRGRGISLGDDTSSIGPISPLSGPDRGTGRRGFAGSKFKSAAQGFIKGFLH